MTAADAANPRAGALWLRAWAVTTGVVVGVGFAVITAVSAAGYVDSAHERYAWWGLAAAAGAAAFGIGAKSVAVTLPATAAGGRAFLAAMTGDFVLQLLAVSAGMVALFLSETKFAGLAAFALAFATAAFLYQLGAAVIMNAALRQRGR